MVWIRRRWPISPSWQDKRNDRSCSSDTRNQDGGYVPLRIRAKSDAQQFFHLLAAGPDHGCVLLFIDYARPAPAEENGADAQGPEKWRPRDYKRQHLWHDRWPRRRDGPAAYRGTGENQAVS